MSNLPSYGLSYQAMFESLLDTKFVEMRYTRKKSPEKEEREIKMNELSCVNNRVPQNPLKR